MTIRILHIFICQLNKDEFTQKLKKQSVFIVGEKASLNKHGKWKYTSVNSNHGKLNGLFVSRKNDERDFLSFIIEKGTEKSREQYINTTLEENEQEDKKYTGDFGKTNLEFSVAGMNERMNGSKLEMKSNVIRENEIYLTQPLEKTKHKAVFNRSNVNQKVLKRMNLKVLIVEDDIASAMLLKLLFRNISNEVLTVKNGLDAVKVCRENKDIDLITMDLQIAGINGFEATRQIREFNKDVVIIAQSAYAMVHDKKKALSVGCNDFITKPIEKSEFISLVNKYFQ